MLRLTDIRLPLDHPASALTDAILSRLGITADELSGYTIAKRSYDARRRGAIVLIYSVDVETPREAHLLRTLETGDGESRSEEAGPRKASPVNASIKLGPTPDTSYQFVARMCSTIDTSRNVPMCGLLTYSISSGAPASTNSRSTLRPWCSLSLIWL